MSKIIINGGKRLFGEVNIHGAKNSVLPILAATVLCEGRSVIHNCPQLSDVEISLDILRHLGCECSFENSTAVINTKKLNCYQIPDQLMREMRSSVVFLGAILGKCGRAVISSPGGCELGPRPIDLHISALKKLGAKVKENYGLIEFEAESRLKGTKINLSFPSVGATENIILAAATAKGVTIINNAAKEPEISDLADYLNSCGAKIYGSGSDTLVIHGVEALGSCEHTIIPDRIAAATYMAAAAVTGGSIVVSNIMPSHLVAVNSVFEEAGCVITPVSKGIRLDCPERLSCVPTIRTLVYPGFPTDAGPIIVSMLSLANGTSVFVENIFENRFRYIDELKRFGAKIKTEGKVAVVEGVEKFTAAPCKCTDLRGGVALVIAALAAKGDSVIDETSHIKRGYENITARLSSLGADIYEEV